MRTSMPKWALLAVVAGAIAVGLPSTSRPAAASGKLRTYYIAAEPVRWNYAPSGRNLVTGEPFGPLEDTYVKRAPNRIGSMNWKGLSTGSTPTPRSARASPRGRAGRTSASSAR